MAPSPPPPRHLLLNLVLAFLARGASSQECPCVWFEVGRTWDCFGTGMTSVPVDCWGLHPQVNKLYFEAGITSVGSQDFAHENLKTVTHLELPGVNSIEDDGLTNMGDMVFLDLQDGLLTHLPDLSTMTQVMVLLAGNNRLVEGQSLVHMTMLAELNLQNNAIVSLPDQFLPNPNRELQVNLLNNAFLQMNASSIVSTYPGSYLALDPLQVIWATLTESETLEQIHLQSNIDLMEIVHVTDTPINP